MANQVGCKVGEVPFEVLIKIGSVNGGEAIQVATGMIDAVAVGVGPEQVVIPVWPEPFATWFTQAHDELAGS